jgi:hypothetical protein
VGFTAQTLKREFFDLEEDGEAALGGAIGGILGLGPALGPILEVPAVHYNRMHFLAGRRSWRVGAGTVFGVNGDVSVLETIAVERLSARFFQVGEYIFGLEGKIPDIWIAMLNNFITKKGLNPIDQSEWGLTQIDQSLKAKWQMKYRNIYYFVKNDFQDLNSLRAHPEFLDAYPLFPTILP